LSRKSPATSAFDEGKGGILLPVQDPIVVVFWSGDSNKRPDCSREIVSNQSGLWIREIHIRNAEPSGEKTGSKDISPVEARICDFISMLVTKTPLALPG
jgi:hypothetical protein